jgi:hypothetical protein
MHGNPFEMTVDIFTNYQPTKKQNWISFESDPHLSQGKRILQQRCIPCMEHLYRQLEQEQDIIELAYAYHCWKVVVVLQSTDECLRVLESYRNRFLPGRTIRGRYGSKDGSGNPAIVAAADSEAERDLLMKEMAECLADHSLDRELFYAKGCADPYEEILGPWQTWKKSSPVLYPENARDIMQRIGRLLNFHAHD